VLEIIDVGGLRSGDPAAVARVATQLGRACRDTGFFYVSNHGIP
jgi:isopenicillin N synthase-like dioxygenase